MSTGKKLLKEFASYDSRRATSYVKGKYGYDEGFLPSKASPIRYARPMASAEHTARPPSSKNAKPQADTLDSRWKRETSDRRRSYMSRFIEEKATQAPLKEASDKKRMLDGVARREAKLNVPYTESEKLAFPSLDSTIADEYPLVDKDKDARLQLRARNREIKESRDRENRLHHFLTLHHHSMRYITNLEDLDTLVQQQITDLEVTANPPKHAFPSKGSWTHSGRTKQIEDAVYDEILGTAAGLNPGILEVSKKLREDETTPTT